ncbi:MAG: hypothetical protein KDJ29_08235, partial [Hyphomicrobiales bacterium]|nr:hypothetical protein [Hyphomicrobiales bacterium]
RDRWAMAGALAVAVAIATVAIWTPAALVGIALGALVVSIARVNPPRLAFGLGVLAAFLFLIAPAIPLIFEKLGPVPGLPLAFSKSLSTWAQIIHADPARLVSAYGLETLTRGLINGFLPAQTPRSILFEIWFEFGIMGAIAAAATSMATFSVAGRAPPQVAPFMLAGFTCVLTIAIFGLATLQLWWLTIVAVMAIGFGCTIKGKPRGERPGAPKAFAPPAPQPA